MEALVFKVILMTLIVNARKKQLFFFFLDCCLDIMGIYFRMFLHLECIYLECFTEKCEERVIPSTGI